MRLWEHQGSHPHADGTDFAKMDFDADVLKPANGEAIYVDGMAVAP